MWSTMGILVYRINVVCTLIPGAMHMYFSIGFVFVASWMLSMILNTAYAMCVFTVNTIMRVLFF